MKTSYTSECHLLLFTLCVAASCIGQSNSYSLSEASGQSIDDVAKDSLGRLARGLQMLRLGKRLPSGGDDSQEAELLKLLFQFLQEEGARDEERRQPPVPRYGRNLEGGRYPSVYRPAPRGGRYKRANVGGLPSRRSLHNGRNDKLGVRTVVMPRIGRYLDALSPPHQGVGAQESTIKGASSQDNVLSL